MLRTPPDAETLARLRERVHQVDAATALAWYRADAAVIVDVREPHEYAQAHVPGAALHPLSVFDPAGLPDPGDRRLLLHCAVGVRCGHAALALVRAGHPGPVYRLEGGIAAWQAAQGPLEAGAPR
ncbi:rhodanese-like domain-containing protein [Roseospira goensis]|uniref:Rhodanese-related sulfurtransferase n=1 Tax=Roseospira goensis TaxID=391922 RepID=A0A7W6S2R1_9PROT|nr:rhodanese-like domain-containing protein [Roseospira goensis]MBB4287813.1 rhodanese-related sulfurtransferase [Roseospira goensis]